MNVDFMGWNLTDVAPEGHPNEGLTILQRMEKYGIDPELGALSYNSLLNTERKEAVAAGIAPDVPITAEAQAIALTYPGVQAFLQRQQMSRILLFGGIGAAVLWMLSRKRR